MVVGRIDPLPLIWIRYIECELMLTQGGGHFSRLRAAVLNSTLFYPVGAVVEAPMQSDLPEQGVLPLEISERDASPVPRSDLSFNGIRARHHGAVFTRPEVAEFILDLVGYTSDQPLYRQRLLEPSFGSGDFLFPIINRLLKAWRSQRGGRDALACLGNAIRAVELDGSTYQSTRKAVVAYLNDKGVPGSTSIALARRWLIQGDFLLTPLEGGFDFVVGNPPWVRQELIPAEKLAAYRRLYVTMFDRADLYVPFLERSLTLLALRGSLGVICSDRWMKNRYGGPLRRMVAENFHLKICVDMVGTQAFRSDVIAYPAITIISREAPGAVRVASRPTVDYVSLACLSARLRAPKLPHDNTMATLCDLSMRAGDGGNTSISNYRRNKESVIVRELPCAFKGANPWLLGEAGHTDLIRRLEVAYPTLEETGCKVGIGVATGADRAFIGDYDQLDVEPECKLQLVTTKDVASGEVMWRGKGVINPFADDGRLVNLIDYPRLYRYLMKHRAVIAGRYCAKKSPASWYRTIDRIDPSLASRPKLLIPDIKGEAHVVYEPGGLYPHHNLYYIVSDEWDLRALQAVLLSSVARLFVASYSTRMRGGFLRFQAQYLRRICLPYWKDVPLSLRQALVKAAAARDISGCNAVVRRLYGLGAEEWSVLIGDGNCA